VRVPALIHEPALDGVRALAVLAVLVFHADPQLLPGGFIGVDVFFALSGYLITGILLHEYRERGRIRLGRFWARRWWRLGPAALMLLLVYGAVLAVWLPPESWPDRGWDVLLVLGYVSNWARALNWHPLVDLGHTWSLAVEMQFYLIWPLLLWGILRWTQRPMLRVGLVVLLALASWLWRVYLQDQGASLDRLYNGTDVRVETLLWGAALALMVSSVPNLECMRRHEHWLQWGVPLALLSWMAVADWTHPVVYSLGITGVSLLTIIWLHGLHHGRWQGHLVWLRMGPLVWLGQMSYGVYLWHFPIIRVLLEWPLSGLPLVFWTLLLTLLVASVSRRFLELPLLERRDSHEARHTQ
jgi:peptidoglycan/LPS O-acetylase OafA/YrhL